MKNILKTVLYVIAGVAIAGCAKQAVTGPNEANIRYFDSWIKVNHPDIRPTGLGIYVLEEEQGTGIEVKEDGFVYADYVVTDLDGNITFYTDKITAKQLGKYDTTAYYGPKVISTVENTIQAGVAEALIGMKAGGRKKVIIPGWLMSYAKYDTEEEYRKKSSSGTNTIYDITVRDYTDSIQNYEVEQIKKYIADNPQIFDSRMTNDTTGFYYQTLSEKVSTEKFEKDTTIYINYTGRLLNGLVFDTTDERIAKDNGLYSSSKTYAPVSINWKKDYSDITMGSSSSSVITGFALTLSKMHPMEKGIGVFYSGYGYSYSGSGSGIPGYAPLIFEIEIVAKPEN